MVRTGNKGVAEDISDVMRSPRIEMINIDGIILEQARELFFRLFDKGVSFTDATTMAVMQLENIGKIITFDSHFNGLFEVLDMWPLYFTVKVTSRIYGFVDIQLNEPWVTNSYDVISGPVSLIMWAVSIINAEDHETSIWRYIENLMQTGNFKPGKLVGLGSPREFESPLRRLFLQDEGGKKSDFTNDCNKIKYFNKLLPEVPIK